MIKAKYETYSFSGELCVATGQSVVECRLPALEVTKVLDVNGTATLVNYTPENGSIGYTGKLLLTVLYEDSEGRVNRAERGAEFFHKAEHEKIAPAHFAVGRVAVKKVDARKEGASVILSAYISCEFTVYGRREIKLLQGGEELAVKTGTGELIKTVLATATFEEEDEFETEYLEGVLSHTERVFVTSAICSADGVEVNGELGLQLCVLKRDGSICSYERLVPIHAKVPAEGLVGLAPAEAEISVQEALFTVHTDEEKGTAKVAAAFTLRADCKGQVKEEITVCEDAYAPKYELALYRQKEVGRYLTNAKIFTERIACPVAVDGAISEDARLRAVLSPVASVTAVSGANGAVTVEGVVEASLLCENEGGGYASTPFTMPFAVTVTAQGEEFAADAFACGVGVRRRAGTELEAEGTVKIALRSYERVETEAVTEVEEREEREENDAAISVYLPKAGDDLWTTAKRLSQFPEEFKKCNEGLVFPLKGEERLFVYRQKGEK